TLSPTTLPPTSTTTTTTTTTLPPTTTTTTLPPTTTTTTTTLSPTTTLPATPIEFGDGEVARIIVTGDSVTDQWIPHLMDLLGDAAEVVDRAHGGTALCDWFEEQGTDISLERLADWRPHVLVIDHSGNSFTPCIADHVGADYYSKYRMDAEYAIGLAAQTDTRVLFVAQPVSRTQKYDGVALPPFQDHPVGTNYVFAALPESFPDGSVRHVSTWPVLSPAGRFVQESTCAAHEPGCVDGTGFLRSPPPGGHLEPLGAWRYALLVADELVAAGWLSADAVSRG
ncbi:MAG: hypothetical protein VX287_03335, partial [Actinomycetota bacterium]|nr:hypothetical protein [Actinomycetota bacterium]